VLALVFFNVSGGPIGSEAVISSAGPLVGLLSMICFTLLFSLPQAMITAELSTAFPSNGGYSLWVQTAFGDFWAVQESYWSWFSGVVDSALYPVLLYSTAQQLIAGLGGSDGGGADGGDGESGRNVIGCLFTERECAEEYGIKLAILTAFAAPNMLSSRAVGMGVSALGVLVMAPYVALACVGLPKWRASTFMMPPTTPRLGKTLSVCYWCLSGFDSASTFAGEVEAPSSTFPRALSLACAVMLLCYLLPLFVAAGADSSWKTWTDGSLSEAARSIGGTWLGVWVVASTMFSNWGLFASELLEDSFQLLGMADAGLAPRCFRERHPYFGTPLRAIALQLLIIAVLIGLDFDVILCVDNFFSAAAASLEFAAAVHLRAQMPELERPFRIPVGTAGLAFFLLIPVGTSVLVMVVTAKESRASLIICAAATAVGGLLYLPFVRRARSTRTTVRGQDSECGPCGSVPPPPSAGGDA
jgi:amino acid transporter